MGGDLPEAAVVGTDTGVGKTFVAEALLRTARAAGFPLLPWKPIASGGDEDAARLSAAAGVSPDEVATVRIAPPLSPRAAARRGVAPPVSLDALDAARAARRAKGGAFRGLLVEGIGGVACPLAPGLTWLGLHARWQTPCLLVGRLALGTLSQTLLSFHALAERGIPVRAIVLSEGPRPISPEEDPSVLDNAEILAEETGRPVVTVPANGPAPADELLGLLFPAFRREEVSA